MSGFLLRDSNCVPHFLKITGVFYLLERSDEAREFHASKRSGKNSFARASQVECECLRLRFSAVFNPSSG